ncbi:MAG: hypothetical protein ABIT76_01610 [Chthoniobacterales bacterium]
MSKLICIVLVLLSFIAGAIGDSPIPPSEDQIIKSPNAKFEASITLEPPQTTVFDVSGAGQRQLLWSKPGFHRIAFLADDGRHLITVYGGANLIPLDYSPGLVLLEFFDGPKLVRRVTVSEIMPDLSKLERSVSHYAWGNRWGLDSEGYFNVETVDLRRLKFDVSSGKIVITESHP